MPAPSRAVGKGGGARRTPLWHHLRKGRRTDRLCALEASSCSLRCSSEGKRRPKAKRRRWAILSTLTHLLTCEPSEVLCHVRLNFTVF
ncbi:Hypothetical predicted protein [Podarcis lilfordi]|uniref:Uncharacterized protein n=1 Tax=Podarcis lilfordi TaxID=74358 RepID=A0AA35PIT6_9SAUR|nr:Hypothetical predicted protein [Podarcis lilfordi]